MPNWCENKLTIENCSSELREYLADDGLSFEKIKPTPPEMMDGDNSWHQWRNDHWGTKWDLDEEEQRYVADCLIAEDCAYTAQFSTAWAPPLEAIDALSKIFPHDKFVLKYFEPGVGFAGSSRISNGVRVDHEIPENDVLKFGSDEFDFSTEH
jgi:hypothetical protein